MESSVNAILNLGQLCCTRTIYNLMTASDEYNCEIGSYIERHISGDFGEIDEEDKEVNLQEIKENNGRALSHYCSTKGDIYIITDLGKSESDNVTTIMFCNEY